MMIQQNRLSTLRIVCLFVQITTLLESYTRGYLSTRFAASTQITSRALYSSVIGKKDVSTKKNEVPYQLEIIDALQSSVEIDEIVEMQKAFVAGTMVARLNETYLNVIPVISVPVIIVETESTAAIEEQQMDDYSTIRNAIIKFKELNGHTAIPSRFIVPDMSNDWSSDCWRLELGKIAADIRNGDYEDNHEDLYNLGFDFFPPATTEIEEIIVESEEIIEEAPQDVMTIALSKYKEIYHNTQIQTNFIAPDGDSMWPEETWGFKLGSTINKLRRDPDFKNIRLDLMKIGIDLKPTGSPGLDIIKEGLLRYRELNGDMFVPFRFVIPHEDSRWPESTWSLKLGSLVRKIRAGEILNAKSDKDDLLSIGFEFESQRKAFSYDLIRSALIQYKEIYGYLLIPGDFKVPSNTELWPESVWGLQLGAAASSISEKGFFTEKKKDLISIGFDFSDKKKMKKSTLKRDTVRAAIVRFEELNGHFNIPLKFIVPEGDTSWSKNMWGLELGARVNVENKSKRLENDHLTALGF